MWAMAITKRLFLIHPPRLRSSWILRMASFGLLCGFLLAFGAEAPAIAGPEIQPIALNEFPRYYPEIRSTVLEILRRYPPNEYHYEGIETW